MPWYEHVGLSKPSSQSVLVGFKFCGDDGVVVLLAKASAWSTAFNRCVVAAPIAVSHALRVEVEGLVEGVFIRSNL